MRLGNSVLIGALTAAVTFIPSCISPDKDSSAYVQNQDKYSFVDIGHLSVVPASDHGILGAMESEVRASDNPEMYAVIEANDAASNNVYFSNLRNTPTDGTSRISFSRKPTVQWDEKKYGPVEIKWFEIKSESGFYNNTVPSQSRITYKEVPVGTGWSLKPGLGTHRYKIKVNYSGGEFDSSPKMIFTKDGVVIGGEVIHVREGDDLPGRMTEREGPPYIYGSSARQVEMYVGGDCADIITGALHKMGRNDIPYTYSQGFGRFGDPVFRGYIDMQGRFLDRNRNEVNDLDIRRGDLLVYQKPQHHVAVFYSDIHKSGDPIDVIQTYDAKGVHRETMYSGSVSTNNIINSFSELFLGRNFVPPKNVTDNRLDTVEVLRLR